NRGADIFIINSFPFYSLAGSLGKPVISINYGVVSSQGMPLKRRLFYKYMDFTQNYFYFRKSSAVISISGYLNNILPSYLRKKTEYIHLGADHYQATEISVQQIEDFRNRFNIKKDDYLLLYVGRLNPVNQPYKGTIELIELFHMAAGKNSKIKLMMVGFGSGNDEIAIKNEGIISIANAPWEMMPVIYASCDTYATCTRWEGFDLPVAEAQNFGKPSVCYNLCAHPEISENAKTGFLVNTKEEFLSRILELAGDSVLLSQMSLNAKKNSDNFTWEKTVDKYDLAIKKILSEKSSDFNFTDLADTVKKESKIPKNNTCTGNDVSDVTLNKSESSAGKVTIGDSDALLSESSEIENDASVINTYRSASAADSTINGNKDTNIADVSTVGNNASAKTFGESETDKGREITCFKDTRVPDVSVIIINYNSSLPCLMECIHSLKSQTFRNIEIIIFDNASTNGVFDSLPKALYRDTQYHDNSLGGDALKTEDIKIKLEKNSSNEGLGSAINKALRNIESKYVLISNFDVTYDKNAVEELVRTADRTDDEIIGLAPKIKFSHLKDYIESVGTYLDNSLYDGYQGLGQIDLHQYDVPENIFGVSFTSAFLKTSAFLDSSVGKVDESFFLFYEDFDFCFRAGLAGYKFRTCPLAIVYHKYSYSFREESSAFETKYYYKRLNLLKMMYKNADLKTIDRLLPIETGIMKQNLKDKNLRNVSARILRDLR
ncbi:MAG: glycosyltransferase, partial [Actinomycetota bacterium]